MHSFNRSVIFFLVQVSFNKYSNENCTNGVTPTMIILIISIALENVMKNEEKKQTKNKNKLKFIAE